MTSKQFIYKVIGLYRSARIPKFRDLKISRGRSRSISSLLEDLFALFLTKNIKCDQIYVDQPTSIAGFKTNYPDISVVKSGKITSFCDLKTDMGWNRDGLKALCRHHYSWLKRARGKSCILRDGKTKKQYDYLISKNASYNIIIMSEHNMNREKLYEQIKNSKIYYPAVEVFVLTSGEHLNTYNISQGSLMNLIDVHRFVFKKLLNKLNK